MKTPMQALKNQFDAFKKMLPVQFQETALNKSEDYTHHSYWCGEINTVEIKGVKSDFIKTFKVKFNDVDSYSIGFSFKYLDLPEADHKIRVTLKIGNTDAMYYKSEDFDVEKFRTMFNASMEKVQAVPVNLATPIQQVKTICDVFMNDFALREENHQEIKSRKNKEVEKRKLRM